MVTDSNLYLPGLKIGNHIDHFTISQFQQQNCELQLIFRFQGAKTLRFYAFFLQGCSTTITSLSSSTKQTKLDGEVTHSQPVQLSCASPRVGSPCGNG